MINVKGAKSNLKPEDGADRYRQSESESLSKTPFLLGGFFAGVIVFVRSLFGDANADSANSSPPAPDTTAFAAPIEDRIAQPTPEPSVQDTDIFIPTDRGDSTNPTLQLNDGVVVSLFKPRSELETAPVQAARQPGSDDPYDQWLENNIDDTPQQNGSPAPKGDASDKSLPASSAPKPTRPEATTDARTPNVNHAPVKSRSVILRDISSCVIIFIALEDLLGHTVDPDGDQLQVQNLTASSGHLVEVEDGYHYTPDPAILGPVQLSYDISDGTHTISQMAHFITLPEELMGTRTADTLNGSECSEEIDAKAGNDTVQAMAGNDIIFGGDGDDHIDGGSGDDVIFGGAGNDIIFGRGGNDIISGGDGSDEVHGGEGDDVIDGDGGNDVLDGGDGRDIITGGTGDDIIIGTSDKSDDVMDGGDGEDTLDFGLTAEGVTIDLRAGTAYGTEIGKDEFKNIEIVIGGTGDDLFVIGKSSVTLVGGQGNDTYRFDFDDDDDDDDEDDDENDDDDDDDKDDGPDHYRDAATITDFEIGDVIKAGSQQIYRRRDDKDDDDDDETLDSLLGGSFPDAVLYTIDYVHEMYTDEEFTIVRISQDELGHVSEIYLRGSMTLDHDTTC